MPLKMGYSPHVVSGNIKEMMKAGHPQKQAIAAALAMKRKSKKMQMADGGMVNQPTDAEPQMTLGQAIGFPGSDSRSGKKTKKMAVGGMVGSPEEYDDNEDPMVPHKGHGAMRTPPMQTSMAQMDKEDPEDYLTSLNQNRYNSYSAVPENEVENPNEINEASMLAKALKNKYNQMMSPENYAMGGLVQPMHDPDMGNKPSESMKEAADEDPEEGHMPSNMGLEHSQPVEPSGMGLSKEAKEALMRKKKGRRYPQVTV